MSNPSDKASRRTFPVPEVPHGGLTLYEAKDPETKYPPIRESRPPNTAPNGLVILIGNKFGSEVNWVAIDLGRDAVGLDHFISPTQQLHVTMALQ